MLWSLVSSSSSCFMTLLYDPGGKPLQPCDNLPQVIEQILHVYVLGYSCYQSSLAPPIAPSHAHVSVLT